MFLFGIIVSVPASNSPFTINVADAGANSPLTVPAGATGMFVGVRDGAAGEGVEVALSSTKGSGVSIGRGTQEYFRFSALAAPEAYHLNSDGTGLVVHVVYTTH